MKAVLFDLFETLVTQKYSDRPTEQSFVDKLGLNLDEVRAWWGDHARERMIGKFATYQEMLSALCGSLGASVGSAAIEEISSDRLRRKREYLLGVDAEMLQVLSQLRSNGWTIGIVSNATPDEVADWSECPLRDAVDDAVFSCQIGALLHESYRVYRFRLLFLCQLIFSTLYDWGLPTWIIRLRMAQPKRLSTCWFSQLRAFSLSPMRCL